MSEPLYTEACTSTEDPCKQGGVFGFLRECTREDYAAMWSLALVLRGALIQAWVSMPAGANRDAVAEWLKRWTSSDAVQYRLACVAARDPNVPRRFMAPEDLGILDANDLGVSGETFGSLIFNDVTDALVTYVRDGNELASDLGASSPELELARRRVCESGLIDDLADLGNAAAGGAALLLVGVVVVAGVFLLVRA